MFRDTAYFQSDLDEICGQTKSFLSEFSSKTILIAGATGFVGSWLVSCLEYMNENYNANFEILAVSRRENIRSSGLKKNTKTIYTDLADPTSKLALKFDCVFNCATPSTVNHGGFDINQVLTSSVTGTKNLLNWCGENSKPMFINLSSGIVTKRKTDSDLDLTSVKDAYLYGKRISESLILEAISSGSITGKNLRLYAFAGPGIPLDQHFAVGNFVKNAFEQQPILIKGNPATLRSYLYPTDLIVNILNSTISHSWKELEIGSKAPVSMRQLAEITNEVTGNTGIIQYPHYGLADEYFPKLNSGDVSQLVYLPEAIRRWIRWLTSAEQP